MKKENIIFETFENIYYFQRALKRKENDFFANKKCESKSNDSAFTFTKNYEEAETLLQNGYKEVVEEIKIAISNFKKSIVVKKNRVKKDIRGYAPIVPAVIKGVPKSMYNNEKVSQTKKQKCIRIVYNLSCRGSTPSAEIKDCGLAILKLCMLLDLNGIRTKLDIIPKLAEASGVLAGCLVTIKEYKQPLNTLKVCHPIVHPSFFRRHGFRWLETVPNLKGSWSGYGRSLQYLSSDEKEKYIKELKLKDENTVYIEHNDCVNCEYDVKRLLSEVIKIKL